MDPAGVPAPEELLVEGAVFAEVLAEVEEYSPSALLKVDLVPSDARGSVVDRERYQIASPLLETDVMRSKKLRVCGTDREGVGAALKHLRP